MDPPNQDYHIDIFLDISKLADFAVELPKSVTLKNHEKLGKDWSDQNYAICQGNDMEGMVIPMFMRKRYAVCVCKLLVLRL